MTAAPESQFGHQRRVFPLCCQDGWRGEEVLELLECFGSIIAPCEVVRLLEKFEER